jgi:type IV secretion system protein VirB10
MSDEEQDLNDENNVSEELEEQEQEIEGQYADAAELTEFSGAPAWFDRKKLITVLSVVFCIIVLLGLVFSTKNSSKKKQTAAEAAWAANVPKDFLQRELERALAGASPATRSEIDKLTADFNAGLISEEEYLRRLLEIQNEAANPTTDQYGFPLVTTTDNGRTPSVYMPYDAQGQYPQQQQQQQSTQRQPQPQLSSLVPKVEGNLFSSQASQSQQVTDPYAALLNNQASDPYAAILSQMAASSAASSANQANLLGSLLSQAGLTNPYAAAAQSEQDGKNNFYNAASGGAIGGMFLQDNLLWIGTIIPAVLETAINTDLPGNIIARVTENIYDSHTGKNILIPQGTLLVAKYNNSVSYAQHRVQVVWDILIRPDGYQVQLEGMNGVDPRGIAGLKAVYSENWFEYIKAAGIVSLFSLINSSMVEQVAKYGSDDIAAGVITSNAEFIKTVGGNFISRAMNIQPTLTVDSGEKINVMLNKNIYLPPYKNFEVNQRYIRK